MDEILEMAAEVMRQPSGIEMVVALLRYIGRSGIQVNKDAVAQKLLELLPKEGGVLMQTMAEEWIAEGKTIGMQEGRKAGRQETLRLMILRVLQRRFLPHEALLQQVEQQLARIGDEDALNRLVDIALEVIVLPDFALKVQEFVPPAT